MVKWLSWGTGIGYLVFAIPTSTYVFMKHDPRLVLGMIVGAATWFLPVSLVLLLGFRARMTRVEKWMAALPLLVSIAAAVLGFVVVLLSPPGMWVG